MRVGVVGAGGRMGREVCRAVVAHPDLELVAAVDSALAGIDLRQVAGIDVGGLQIEGHADALSTVGVDVAVDFTVATAATETLRFCAAAGIHVVVGTTGFDTAFMEELRGLFAGPDAGSPNCVVAANFAIGAVLIMRFAEMAAPWFDAAEIIELHHAGKLDAPSGTALATALRMAAARSTDGDDPYPSDRTEHAVIEGARGADAAGGVRVHSVRMPGLVAHQEVLLGAVGQTLTIRHDSTDRTSFMDGVVLAVHEVVRRPGLTVGLEPLLGL